MEINESPRRVCAEASLEVPSLARLEETKAERADPQRKARPIVAAVAAVVRVSIAAVIPRTRIRTGVVTRAQIAVPVIAMTVVAPLRADLAELRALFRDAGL